MKELAWTCGKLPLAHPSVHVCSEDCNLDGQCSQQRMIALGDTGSCAALCCSTQVNPSVLFWLLREYNVSHKNKILPVQCSFSKVVLILLTGPARKTSSMSLRIANRKAISIEVIPLVGFPCLRRTKIPVLFEYTSEKDPASSSSECMSDIFTLQLPFFEEMRPKFLSQWHKGVVCIQYSA